MGKRGRGGGSARGSRGGGSARGSRGGGSARGSRGGASLARSRPRRTNVVSPPENPGEQPPPPAPVVPRPQVTPVVPPPPVTPVVPPPPVTPVVPPPPVTPVVPTPPPTTQGQEKVDDLRMKVAEEVSRLEYVFSIKERNLNHARSTVEEVEREMGQLSLQETKATSELEKSIIRRKAMEKKELFYTVKKSVEMLEVEVKFQALELNDKKEYLTSRLKEVEAFFVPPVPHPPLLPQPPPVVIIDENPGESSSAPAPTPIQQLAKDIVEAVKVTRDSSIDDESRKLLARQIHGYHLPFFHGNPEEWPRFRAEYKTSTEECKYSDSENLRRLNRAIKGEARKYIERLLFEPKSVPDIILRLESVYGQTNVILKELRKKLEKVPPVKGNMVMAIKAFGLALDDYVTMCHSLNQTDQLCDPSMLNDLLEKLPASYQMKWVNDRKGESSNLAEFATWMSRYTLPAYKLSVGNASSSSEGNEHNKFRVKAKEHRVFQVSETSEKAKSGQDRAREGNNKATQCSVCNKFGHVGVKCNKFVNADTQQRWKLAAKSKLCFACLVRGHRSDKCMKKKACEVNGCKRFHHPLLHNNGESDKSKKANPRGEDEAMDHSESEVEEVKCVVEEVDCFMSQSNVNFLMAPCFIQTENGPIEAYVVLDSLASTSLMLESDADKLKLVGESRPLKIKGINSTKEYQSRVVSLSLKARYSEFTITLEKVRTVKQLNLPRQSISRKTLKKWTHLSNVPLQPYQSKSPVILIGLDYPSLHLHLNYKMGNSPNAPIAVETNLGWMIMGRVGFSSNEQENVNMLVDEDNAELSQLVKEHFVIDSIGVKEDERESVRTKDDERAQTIIDSTLRRTNGGESWEIGILWKNDNFILPDTYSYSFARLTHMERKMDRDPSFAQEYCERIDEYVKQGYARKLSKNEANQLHYKSFMMPHFMVENLKKKKRRFVFDLAAKVKGKSLNDFILKGPDTLNDLPGILLRFRRGVIGVTGDIKDFFHRVKVREDDKPSQRFLWRGMDRGREPDVYQMEVKVFGAVDSLCAADQAKRANALEFKDEFPKAYESIVDDFYSDDFLETYNSHSEAIQSVKEVSEVNRRGNFTVCNWLSNSVEVNDSIPVDLQSKGLKSLDLSGEHAAERVLGLFWRHTRDEFTFSLSFVKVNEELISGVKLPTKRELLSLIMSVFDPLGFVSTLLIKGKLLMQKIWAIGTDWDTIMPEELTDQWLSFIIELKKIELFHMPRCYSPYLYSGSCQIELHVFCDASSEAYGAVCYIIVRSESMVTSCLCMSKARVCSLKPLSIPRHELNAARIGARLACYVKSQIKIDFTSFTYWSDSTTVLHWINATNSKFNPFIGNRIGEIREKTSINEWKWIPTDLNPADDFTRAATPCDWSSESRWMRGPSFLLLPQSQWPVQPCIRPNDAPGVDIELVFAAHKIIPTIIDVSRFSKLRRLVRATAYVYRFLSIKFPKMFKDKFEKKGAVTLEEEKRAELFLLRQAQRESYPVDFEHLLHGKGLHSESSLIQLGVIMDEGSILRVTGRLENAQLASDIKHPILLNRNHVFTKLLVMNFHERSGHHGRERIHNEIRQRFYVPQLRVAIRSAQNCCQMCKNIRTTPLNPIMGQLPSARLTGFRPFNQTGLDYFGPIDVIVKRSHEKRYVALFTCLATRALHLEVARSLSTDSCLMAIRRFIARRGNCQEIFCDNASNFKGSHNELKLALQELDQDKITATCSSLNIKWVFSIPYNPQAGGSWERLVRSVKVALGDTLQIKNLSDEVFHTLLCEAEHIVNSHPLTHVSDDPHDEEALTPNHFLIGGSSSLQEWGETNKSALFGRKEYRIAQYMANCFWRRWTREYLPTLLRREKWFKQTKPIKIGDIVVEVDPSSSRNSWPKARVIQILPAQDDIIRAVLIKHSNGKIYKRSVRKLCVLDVECTDSSSLAP